MMLNLGVDPNPGMFACFPDRIFRRRELRIAEQADGDRDGIGERSPLYHTVVPQVGQK